MNSVRLLMTSQTLTCALATGSPVSTSETKISVRPPPVWVAPDVSRPFLIGTRRPAIVLPFCLVERGRREELRLVLAHELAHLARRDLLWSCLPAAAQLLFFFHPLVWPARGRISSVYGAQRILNDVPRQPHYGLDIAAPTGTTRSRVRSQGKGQKVKGIILFL